MTYIVMAFDNTILTFLLRTIQNRRWKKAKVNVQNQGKMPLIVFGNGFFNDMAIKRHMAAPIKKIYANLKRRERLGQAVIVQIDEYLTSQVHSYFLFFCCYEHVIDAFFYSVQICNNCQKRELEKWVAADGGEFHGVRILPENLQKAALIGGATAASIELFLSSFSVCVSYLVLAEWWQQVRASSWMASPMT